MSLYWANFPNGGLCEETGPHVINHVCSGCHFSERILDCCRGVWGFFPAPWDGYRAYTLRRVTENETGKFSMDRSPSSPQKPFTTQGELRTLLTLGEWHEIWKRDSQRCLSYGPHFGRDEHLQERLQIKERPRCEYEILKLLQKRFAFLALKECCWRTWYLTPDGPLLRHGPKEDRIIYSNDISQPFLNFSLCGGNLKKLPRLSPVPEGVNPRTIPWWDRYFH